MLTLPIAVHPMVQTRCTRRESVSTLCRPGIVPHLEIIEPSINFEPASRHIPNYYHAIFNCKPVHTDRNLNGFPLRSVLVRGYKYYYSKMTAHSSSTPHPQKQTSHSSSFPCICHGQHEFWVERFVGERSNLKKFPTHMQYHGDA